MADFLTSDLAQLDPTVGDIAGNAARLRRAREAATGCDLLVCAELARYASPGVPFRGRR